MALDVGDHRIGVATTSTLARLPSPLVTLIHSTNTANDIKQLIKENSISAVVIGRPRGLDGQVTAQTKIIDDFAEQMGIALDVPIYRQDEAVTSKQAESELIARGKPYTKGDIDALAAVIILNDFLASPEGMKL